MKRKDNALIKNGLPPEIAPVPEHVFILGTSLKVQKQRAEASKPAGFLKRLFGKKTPEDLPEYLRGAPDYAIDAWRMHQNEKRILDDSEQASPARFEQSTEQPAQPPMQAKAYDIAYEEMKAQILREQEEAEAEEEHTALEAAAPEEIENALLPLADEQAETAETTDVPADQPLSAKEEFELLSDAEMQVYAFADKPEEEPQPLAEGGADIAETIQAFEQQRPSTGATLRERLQRAVVDMANRDDSVRQGRPVETIQSAPLHGPELIPHGTVRDLVDLEKIATASEIEKQDRVYASIVAASAEADIVLARHRLNNWRTPRPIVPVSDKELMLPPMPVPAIAKRPSGEHGVRKTDPIYIPGMLSTRMENVPQMQNLGALIVDTKPVDREALARSGMDFHRAFATVTMEPAQAGVLNAERLKAEKPAPVAQMRTDALSSKINIPVGPLKPQEDILSRMGPVSGVAATSETKVNAPRPAEKIAALDKIVGSTPDPVIEVVDTEHYFADPAGDTERFIAEVERELSPEQEREIARPGDFLKRVASDFDDVRMGHPAGTTRQTIEDIQREYRAKNNPHVFDPAAKTQAPKIDLTSRKEKILGVNPAGTVSPAYQRPPAARELNLNLMAHDITSAMVKDGTVQPDEARALKKSMVQPPVAAAAGPAQEAVVAKKASKSSPVKKAPAKRAAAKAADKPTVKKAPAKKAAVRKPAAAKGNKPAVRPSHHRTQAAAPQNQEQFSAGANAPQKHVVQVEINVTSDAVRANNTGTNIGYNVHETLVSSNDAPALQQVQQHSGQRRSAVRAPRP